MDRIFVFLIRNDVWIYIISGLGLIWYLTEFWRSRRQLKSAMFGLEKERGRRAFWRSLILILLFLVILLSVTYVNIEIAPTLPAELLKPPTPTPNFLATPLSSPTPRVSPDAPATLAVAPTVTLAGSGGAIVTSPAETPTIIDEPTPTPNPGVTLGPCSPEINIISPPSGTQISAGVTVFGTASGDQFGFYDLEAFGPQTNGSWISLLEQPATTPIFDGILATIDFSSWATGDYLLRLRVLSTDREEIGTCTIEIQH